MGYPFERPDTQNDLRVPQSRRVSFRGGDLRYVSTLPNGGSGANPGGTGGSTGTTGTARFAGDPRKVSQTAMLWGTSSNLAITRYEGTDTVPIYRRFYRSYTGAALNTMYTNLQDDARAGRLPFMTIKTDYIGKAANASWHATLKADVINLLQTVVAPLAFGSSTPRGAAIAGTAYPVWFGANHEPEDDYSGDPNSSLHIADWKALQATIRAAINESGVPNVAMASVYMAWTFSGASRDHARWIDAGQYADIIGLDYYAMARSINPVKYSSLVATTRLNQLVQNVLQKTNQAVFFAEMGVSKWLREENLAAWKKEITDFMAWCEARPQILGASYFNSSLSSVSYDYLKRNLIVNDTGGIWLPAGATGYNDQPWWEENFMRRASGVRVWDVV